MTTPDLRGTLRACRNLIVPLQRVAGAGRFLPREVVLAT
jgi:hypothetical protein